MDIKEIESLEWFKVWIVKEDTYSTIYDALRKDCDKVIQKKYGKKYSTSVFDEKLEKSVYIIRFSDKFRMKYKKGSTPVLYIGQGNFMQRIQSHLYDWLRPLSEYTGDVSYEALVSFPRERNCLKEDQHLEALLLGYFREKYGSLPFRNKQDESKQYPHEYSRAVMREVLNVRMDAKRYYWEISPLNFISGTFCERKSPDGE